MPGERLSSEVDISQPCALELACILRVFSQKYLCMAVRFCLVVVCFIGVFCVFWLGFGWGQHALSVLTVFP